MQQSYSQTSHAVNPTRKDGGVGKRSAFALMSPGGACWICERPLVRFPQAVLVAFPEHDLFFLVCSERCGDAAIADLAGFVAATLMDGLSAFARGLDAAERHVILPSNKAYECARRGGRLRLRIFTGPDSTDLE